MAQAPEGLAIVREWVQAKLRHQQEFLEELGHRRPEAEALFAGSLGTIRESLARNVPYDRFVRAILAASGTPATAPPVQWYRRLKATDAFVDVLSSLMCALMYSTARYAPVDTAWVDAPVNQ